MGMHVLKTENPKKLKADRPHPRNYPHAPTDYRRTDKHLRLVIPTIALYCTNGSAVRAHANGQTHGHTDTRTLPSTLSPCFAKATRSIITKFDQDWPLVLSRFADSVRCYMGNF